METKNATITGIASYLPEYILTNEELCSMVDTSNEWIMTRVGIAERHILKGEGLGASELGYRAVNELLKKTNTRPEEVDLLICATSTPDFKFPSTASIIGEHCGIKNAFSYDLQAACSGFIFALQSANAYIKSGLCKKVIVVAAEKMSSITNYTERATCPLFGDGAGAALLEPTTEDKGIVDAVLQTNGQSQMALMLRGGGSAFPTNEANTTPNDHYIHQDGPIVFKHAVANMANVAAEIMTRNQLSMNDVDWLVPHQANLRIIDAVAKRMGLNHDKVMINIHNVGNTSAASIPICLTEWEKSLKKGDNVVLAAFGAGFTWGAMYLKWGYDTK